MLRLRQQVGGDEAGIGRIIGEHEHFAGAGKQVDGDVAEEQALGGHHVGVAGTKDFLDVPDGRRAVCHRGNRLRATHTIDLCGAGGARREKDAGIDLSVLAAGRADDDLLAPGDARERDGHQAGRNQRSRAARNIDSHALERVELLTDCRALSVLGRPVSTKRFAAELLDILCSDRDRFAQGIIGLQ